MALDYQDRRRWSAPACVVTGFLRRGDGILMAGASTSDWARPVADDPANWYLTRGDTDLA